MTVPYDFKVKEIELPISGSSTSDALDNSIRNEMRSDDTSKDTYFIPVAKILNNIKKSYDKGKKYLLRVKIFLTTTSGNHLLTTVRL